MELSLATLVLNEPLRIFFVALGQLLRSEPNLYPSVLRHETVSFVECDTNFVDYLLPQDRGERIFFHIA